MLILLFMVPFMNVAKPKNTNTNQQAHLNRPLRSIRTQRIKKKEQSMVTNLVGKTSLVLQIKKKRLFLVVNYLKSLLSCNKNQIRNKQNATYGFVSTQVKKASALIISLISLTAIYAFFINF